MAPISWSSPRTWTTGELVSASMLNTGLRDLMNETAAAKFTTAGDLFVGTGANAGARLGIGTAGQVLTVAGGVPAWATAPAVRVKHTPGNHTVPSGAGWTYLAFDAEDFDTGGLHDTATNNSRLTASMAGKWAVWANISLNSGAPVSIHLYLNRTSDFGGGYYSVTLSGQVATPFATISLAAGDYVEVATNQTSGSTITLPGLGSSAPRFGMHWIGP